LAAYFGRGAEWQSSKFDIYALKFDRYVLLLLLCLPYTMLYHHFIEVLLLQFALFTLVLSARPKGAAPAVRKPPPAIIVRPPKPISGQGGTADVGNKTPAEKESDWIEQLSDVCEFTVNTIRRN
jgi:hypothetical protein